MEMMGYVQEQQAKYDTDVCLSEWAHESAIAYLRENDINVCAVGSSGMGDTGCPDRWDIGIPVIRTRNGCVRDVDKMNRVIADLRSHPEKVSDKYGEGEYGEDLAAILEAGMKVAEKHDYMWIVVEFLDAMRRRSLVEPHGASRPKEATVSDNDGEGGGGIRPFYVIRINHEGQRPVYWKSHSYPASPSIGEATVFRDASAAGDVRQTVQTWTTGVVEIVAVNLESFAKEVQ